MRTWLRHLDLSPYCYRTYPGTSGGRGRLACPCGWVEQAPSHSPLNEVIMIVLKITRVITDQTDYVSLRLKAPTPYPELDAHEPGKYPAFAKVDVRYGYGLEWVRATFGHEPDENIDARHERTPRELHPVNE